MRTTVDLDPKLLEQLRLEAVRRGVSVKALLNTVIRDGLAGKVAEPRAAYRLQTASLGSPRHPLEHALRLADSLEDDEHRRELQLRK